jgi:hypothetical protein
MTMSMQQIFNKVSRHLIKQNEKSLNKKWKCAYRNTKGLSCAVGCLIPDADYYDKLEGRSVKADSVEEALHSVIGVHYDKRNTKLALLASLQYVHDGDSINDWPEKLEKVRIKFGLEKL